MSALELNDALQRATREGKSDITVIENTVKAISR